MITENTNKLNLKTKSKILVLGLILSVVMGLFAPAFRAQAQATTPTEAQGVCSSPDPENHVKFNLTLKECQEKQPGWDWTENKINDNGTLTTTKGTPPNSDLENQLDNCNVTPVGGGSFAGCVEGVTYFLFVTIPSFIMLIAANIFNFVAALSLSSNMYQGPFIGKIWTIVRDFANIFFILILLYAAFEIILDIGHGGGKKIIASVILIALVVNFSLFFTKIIIDSSNIVALIFYNRIDTSNVATYDQISDSSKPGIAQEKDMAGALVSRFNVNNFFTTATFTKLGSGVSINGQAGTTAGKINPWLLVSAMVMYGIMIFALAYAFFIAGMSFFGRMLNLMMLMIVSPFAFVSYSVPAFKHIDTIGFDSWLKKLLESSFVAAVFMFILYIISEVLKADIFNAVSNSKNTGFISALILIFMPAMLIVTLLLKGAKYAREASGKFTEAAISGAKVATGLGIGIATGGVALAGRATVGAFMKGASTGDTAGNRMAANRAILNNPNSRIGERIRARKDLIQGTIQRGLGITATQRLVGRRLNADQTRVEGYAHARHTLDEVSKARYQGKAYSQLSGPERTWVQNRIDQDILTRNRLPIQVMQPVMNNNGQPVIGPNGQPQMALQNYDYGNKQKFSELSTDAQTALTTYLNGLNAAQRAAIPHGSTEVVQQSRGRQGVISSVAQASRTGTYDVKGLSDVVAKEYNSGFAKFATGLTGLVGKSMRGSFKQMGVNYGKAEGKFLKDLGSTITEALKSAKINVDLSHVGEEKKESGSGGHH